MYSKPPQTFFAISLPQILTVLREGYGKPSTHFNPELLWETYGKPSTHWNPKLIWEPYG